jgi:hypothetical protein
MARSAVFTLEVRKELFEILDALLCKGDGGYVVEVQD